MQWSERTLDFAGYRWQVKEGYTYPGRNDWIGDNVWLDDEGRLHLALRKRNNGWYCAEVRSEQAFFQGLFRFQIIGPLDRLDPQVVLGLFLYEEDSLAEVDVEFSRWGEAGAANGLYSLYGAKGKVVSQNFFAYLPEGEYSTHSIDWKRNGLTFLSQYGHRSDQEAVLSYWQPRIPTDALALLQQPLRVHMNLWLYEGRAPRDRKDVEIIIRDFRYLPEKGGAF